MEHAGGGERATQQVSPALAPWRRRLSDFALCDGAAPLKADERGDRLSEEELNYNTLFMPLRAVEASLRSSRSHEPHTDLELAADLLRGLLERRVDARLGGDGVRAHPFLTSVEWGLLEGQSSPLRGLAA